jgi:repressor LexA
MVTPIQQKIYEFIQQYVEQHTYSPSLTEIAAGIGISPKSKSLVSRSIHSLVAAGRLSFHEKGYRNIQLVQQEQFGLPLMGRIAAGVPIEAIQHQQTIDLAYLTKGNDHYALEVKGDSMIDEGIFDGDYVICRHAQQAREGDIVVALIEEREATLKRISFKIQDRITLIPANPTLKPKAYLKQHVQIQGIYIGLMRIQK